MPLYFNSLMPVLVSLIPQLVGWGLFAFITRKFIWIRVVRSVDQSMGLQIATQIDLAFWTGLLFAIFTLRPPLGLPSDFEVVIVARKLILAVAVLQITILILSLRSVWPGFLSGMRYLLILVPMLVLSPILIWKDGYIYGVSLVGIAAGNSCCFCFQP